MAELAHQSFRDMTKDQLVSAVERYQKYKQYIVNAKQKMAAPIEQFTLTASGWGGGVVSGVVRAFVPEVFGAPVDGVLGVLISLFALTGAGEQIWDATASFGVGLATPAFSRGVEGLIRGWMTAK